MKRDEWENQYYVEKESGDGDMSWVAKKGLELCKSERKLLGWGKCIWQSGSNVDE